MTSRAIPYFRPLFSAFALGLSLFSPGRIAAQNNSPHIETVSIDSAIQYSITRAATGPLWFEFEHGGNPGSLQTLNLTYTIDGGLPQPIQGLNDSSNSIDFELFDNTSQVVHVGSIVTLGPGNLTGSFIGNNDILLSNAANNSFPASYVGAANGTPYSGLGVAIVPEPGTYALIFGPILLLAASFFGKRRIL